MQTPSPNFAPADRRTLVSLAGAILLVFVISGFVAVFGLHYAADQHMRGLDELDRLLSTLDTARAAEVSFKKQVQEWKNILLRGADPADLARYREAFEEEQRRVDVRLESLFAHNGRVDVERIAALLEEHRRLAARYAEALAAFEPTAPAGAARVDRSVRGLDRPFTESLEALVAEIDRRVDAMRAAGRAADAERYRILRNLSIAVSGVGAALVLALLFVALRGRYSR
jgi:hypothetical protein